MKSFFPNTPTPLGQPCAGNKSSGLSQLSKENYEDKKEYSDNNLHTPENTEVEYMHILINFHVVGTLDSHTYLV